MSDHRKIFQRENDLKDFVPANYHNINHHRSQKLPTTYAAGLQNTMYKIFVQSIWEHRLP